MKKIRITETQAKKLKAIINEKKETIKEGDGQIRIVIEDELGDFVQKYHNDILEAINNETGTATLNYYEATNKIVGTINSYLYDRKNSAIRSKLEFMIDSLMEKKLPLDKLKDYKVSIKRKAVSKSLGTSLGKHGDTISEEIPMPKIKGGSIRTDKNFKKAFDRADVVNLSPNDSLMEDKDFNIKKTTTFTPPIPTSYQKTFGKPIFNEEFVKEAKELLKHMYGHESEYNNECWKSDYNEIMEMLERKGVMVRTLDENTGLKTAKLSKEFKTPADAMECYMNEVAKLYEYDPNLPADAQDMGDDDSEYTEPIESGDKYKVLAHNYDIAILKDAEGSLYVFYHDGVDKDDFAPYAEVEKTYIGTDEDGLPEYEYGDFEVDNEVIERYVNDNIDTLKIGNGLEDWENGIDNFIKIDEPLKKEIINLYDKNKDIVSALGGLNETGASASGAFTGALFMSPIKKEMPVDTNNLDVPVVGETTTAASSGQYTAPAFNMKSPTEFSDEKPKAFKKTQFAGGGFVKFNDCVKLNNKPAGAGCSKGAVDNVVKIVKTKDNVNAPSLSESFIYEALKLQKKEDKLIVVSDLEGRAAGQETFKNKNVLKSNGFNWDGNNWSIDASKFEEAKKTLSLVNKAEYLIDTLEDLEDAIDSSNSDKKSLINAKLEQYIKDLANATDEKALSAEIRRYLTFFSKFHDYSFYNRILIYIQKPDAKKVASYKKWQEKHRQVKKGAKGITILAPVMKKDNTPEEEPSLGIGDIKKQDYVRRFIAVTVFDISDTEPIGPEGEIPDEPQWWGDNTPSETADRLFTYLSEVAEDMGINVTSNDSSKGEKGYAAGDHINLSSDISGVGKLSTMIHEIAHELMHFKPSSIYYVGDEARRSSELVELQAESVSYTVLKHYDLPTPQHATYLALWKASKEKIQDNLEVISKVAQFIIEKIDEAEKRNEKESKNA